MTDPTRPQKTWFEIDKDEPQKVAACLIATVKDIEQRQASIALGNMRHARIYAGYLPLGLNNTSANNQRAPFAATKALVRSVCDTATALISKFRPKSTFVTFGANWEVQKQAEDMDIFMAGAYERSGIYQTSPRVFHDSTIFGTGVWKLVERKSKGDYYVSADRVLPSDFIVDEEECRDQLQPENTYHRIFVRHDALIRKYANGNDEKSSKLRAAIMAAANNGASWPNQSIAKNQVVLIDAIHVPEEGKPRRVVAVEGAVLADEDWPYDFQPYVTLWWVPPISGFYGDGVAYRQYGRQERITYLYRWLERCQNNFATPTAWIDPAGGPPALQMSNEIGAIITARKPPTFQVHQAVHPEMYKWIDELAIGGFEDEGINQASSAGALPQGVESAPAQREYSFKESNRFAPVSQRWEHSVAVETAYKLVAMYRRQALKTKGEALKVQWADRKMLYRVSWPDLPEDAYQIRPAASSLESLSPAARVQAAIELSQTNWLRPGEGRALMGHPDLERSDQMDNAGNTYAEMVLKKLLDGEHVDIDEYADLVTLDKVVRAGRLLAITQGAPARLIDNCSDFLDRLDKQIADAAAAAAQQAMGAAPGQMAGPGALSPEAAAGKPMPFAGGKGE